MESDETSHKILNEILLDQFTMLSNEENGFNSEQKCCQICFNASVEEIEADADNLVLQMFPDLDSKLCINLKICQNCKTTMQNLNNFRTRINNSSSMEPEAGMMKEEAIEDKFKVESHNGGYISASSSDVSYNDERSGARNTNYMKNPSYEMYLVGSAESCPTCKEQVAKMSEHLKRHREIYACILYSCNWCNFQHQSLEDLQTHVCYGNRDGPEILYTCTYCPFKSRQKGNLKTHLLVHKSPEEIPMFKCDECSYQTRQKGNLKTHQLTHMPRDKVYMYKCPCCKFASIQKGNLRTHLLKKHQMIVK